MITGLKIRGSAIVICLVLVVAPLDAIAGWRGWTPAFPYSDKNSISADLEAILAHAKKCAHASCTGGSPSPCDSSREAQLYHDKRLDRTDENFITPDIEEMIADYRSQIMWARRSQCD